MTVFARSYRLLLPYVTLSILTYSATQAGTAEAAPLTETQGQLELNWSTMLVRFTGQAQPTPEDGASFKPTERRAWQDALATVGPQFSSLKGSLPGLRDDAADLVRSTSWSKNTTYFSDGQVRVLLENALPKIFANEAIGTAPLAEAKDLPATGVILSVTKSARPVAAWTLRDQTGREVFGPKMVSRNSWEQTLMGRWFRRPGRREIEAHVGAQPVSIDVVPGSGPGELVLVSNLAEEQENTVRYLMATGRVVLAVR
jgi:hypothetical protein